MIALRADTLSLAGRPILRAVDIAFRPGELAVICGPNGAGKTTLLRALAGLLPGTAAPDPRRVAYLPQGARSAWPMTVAQVAALGRLPHGDQDRAAIDRALTACGIAPLRAARVDRISGGQARRAMLARAFATEPRMFLLDEPTADLDPAAQHEILALLRATTRPAPGMGSAAGGGAGVVAVLHGLELAWRYADRLVLVAEGRIAADGPPDAVLPQAAAAFGMRWQPDSNPHLLPPAGP